MVRTDGLATTVQERGFAIVPDVLDEEAVRRLVGAVEALPSSRAEASRGTVFAVRDLLRSVAGVREIARDPRIAGLAEAALGGGWIPARAIFFDKPGGANWLVPWHQDLTIAVRERREVKGFGPWSLKAGVVHVQPPVSILERMVAIRLHLDDCGEENGPLRVLPGTHSRGRLTAGEIQELREQIREEVCLVPRGGAMLMKPLLLHASGRAKSERSTQRRRVIHIEYGAATLPDGLEWYEAGRESMTC